MPARVSGFPASIAATGQATIAVTPLTVGDLMLFAAKLNSASITVTALSGGGVSAWNHIVDRNDVTDARYISLWWGKVSSTGAATITVTYSGANAVSTELVADSWTGAKDWTPDVNGATDYGGVTTTTVTLPSLTPTIDSGGGILYWGFSRTGVAFSSGLTAGFSHTTTTQSDEVIVNPNCAVGTTYQPSYTIGSLSNYDTGAIVFAALAVPAPAPGVYLPATRGPRAVGPTFFASRQPPQPPAPSGAANQSALDATLTFTGAQAQQASKLLAAAVSFTGARVLALSTLLAAALTFTGATVRRVGTLLAGVLSLTGAAARRTGKLLAATVSSAGAFSTLVVHFFTQALTAALTFSGAQARRTGHLAAATATFAGAQSRRTAKLLAATITYAGARAQALAGHLAAAVTFTGAQARRTGHLAAAGLSTAGAFSTQTVHFFTQALSATLTFTGAQSRRTARLLAAAATFTGAQARRTGKALSAAVAMSASLGRRIAKGLAGALRTIGGLVSDFLGTGGGDARVSVSDGPTAPVALSELALTTCAVSDATTATVTLTELALTGCAVSDAATGPVALADAPVNPG